MRLPALLLFAAAGLPAAPSSSPTFYKDVLPVLQARCQGCHRAGEATPMSLLTYKEVRPWAKAIREAVSKGTMPPWFAEAGVGVKFHNDRSLTEAERLTLTRWADSGAAAGNAQDAPPPRQFLDGWNITQPDLVVQMPSDFQIPASGTIEYTYFVVPTGFTEDRWVRMAEIRPGNRRLVHHVIAFIREPGSKWLKDAVPGEAFVPKKGQGEAGQGEFLVGYAPGTVPQMLPEGQAKLVKAGSDIVLQMHYTADGTAGQDRTRVGIVFATEPPQKRVSMLAALNGKFVIPPGADNHLVQASTTLHADATLQALTPHMHLRGKSFEYRVKFPNGDTQTLLNVPRYDFNWQLSYELEKPMFLPKGTVIECTAHFDNSANNAANPDPKSEVRWGDQSWEEMMIGFFEVSFDASLSPDQYRAPRKAPASASSSSGSAE